VTGTFLTSDDRSSSHLTQRLLLHYLGKKGTAVIAINGDRTPCTCLDLLLICCTNRMQILQVVANCDILLRIIRRQKNSCRRPSLIFYWPPKISVFCSLPKFCPNKTVRVHSVMLQYFYFTFCGCAA